MRLSMDHWARDDYDGPSLLKETSNSAFWFIKNFSGYADHAQLQCQAIHKAQCYAMDEQSCNNEEVHENMKC